MIIDHSLILSVLTLCLCACVCVCVKPWVCFSITCIPYGSVVTLVQKHIVSNTCKRLLLSLWLLLGFNDSKSFHAIRRSTNHTSQLIHISVHTYVAQQLCVCLHVCLPAYLSLIVFIVIFFLMLLLLPFIIDLQWSICVSKSLSLYVCLLGLGIGLLYLLFVSVSLFKRVENV